MSYPILSLRVMRFNDETLAEPITVEFGPAGGTIGRASDCTLVLPDQQRAISRVHARIEFRGGDYLLCDLGSNPSVLNQRALGGTREARLADGDRLLVGTYLLEVSIGEPAAGLRNLTGSRDPLAAAQVLGGPLPAESQGDVLRLGSLDPLGQPGFGEQQRISSRPGFAGSESDHVSPELQAFSVPQPAQDSSRTPPPAGGIPADYDPLADALAQWETPSQATSPPPAQAPRHAPWETPAQAGAPPATAPYPVPYDAAAWPSGAVAATPGGPTGLPAGWLDGPAAGAAATPFDDLFGTPPAGQQAAEARYNLTEVIPAQPVAPSPFVPVVPGVPESVDAGAAARAFTAEPARVTPPDSAAGSQPASQPVSQPVVQPFTQPVLPTASPPAFQPASQPASHSAAPPAAPTTPPREHAPAPAPVGTNPGATFTALLEGLGLDATRAPNLPDADFARLIGEMLRESLRGTMAVLRARSMTKREARLDTTMIVARDNNPLKFFPDVDSALAQMMTGRSAGYLPPDEALRRAFNDIEAHELAVIAGMRAALAHVLGRFEPGSIEAGLKEPGKLEKVLSNRKAKLWDLFVELQGAVMREADDDFQKLFGKAFNDAYEAQIEALHAARGAGQSL